MIVRQAKHSLSTWYVLGDSDKEYIIHFQFHPIAGIKVWTCNCPDFTERRLWHRETCKHIDEVKYARSTETVRPFDSSYEQGAAKYASTAWGSPVHLRFRRRVDITSKLNTVLESVQALLNELREG